MRGFIFIAQGDITQFNADAVAYSISHWMEDSEGELASAFNANLRGFAARYRESKNVFRAGRRTVRLGETFWVPLAEMRRPYGVVTVIATGDFREDDPHFAARTAVTAAIDAAVANLREQYPDKRLLLTLPAFRMGMGGDKFQALPSAIAQVEAARAALDRHPGVDVVFVLYTTALYEVFGEARRRADRAYPEERADLPPDLLDAVRGGRCVLFVGAGLSTGAGYLGYGALLQKLAERLSLDPGSIPKDDLFYGLDLAQWYLEQEPDALVPLIKELYGSPGAAGDGDDGAPTLPAVEPTLAHYLLMSLPVRYVITTNYDDLLERTLTALRRYPVKVVGQEEIAGTGGQDGGVYVVKFHGDAETAKVPEDIVLSRDHYGLEQT